MWGQTTTVLIAEMADMGSAPFRKELPAPVLSISALRLGLVSVSDLNLKYASQGTRFTMKLEREMNIHE